MSKEANSNRCYPCQHGGEGEGRHSGCAVNICPYDATHHVHHGTGTAIFDPHDFATGARTLSPSDGEEQG